MIIKQSVFTILSIFLICQHLFAGVGDYDWKVYNREQDFLGVYIYTIAQDDDGFLWIGSDEGLYRYDGKKLLNINEKDSTIDNLVTASLIPREGGVFFGYFKGGVSRYKHSRYNKVFNYDSLPGRINDLNQDHIGHVWALNQSRGLILVKEDSFILEKHQVLDQRIKYCLETIGDRLLVGTNEGLLSFQVVAENEIRYDGVIKGTESVAILSIFKDRKPDSNRIWIGTEDHGVLTLSFDPDNLVIENLEAKTTAILKEQSILSIAEDLDNNLWVGTRLNGLIKISLNEDNDRDWQYTYFNKRTGFVSNQINTLFVDRENEIWVGTFGHGLVQMMRKEVTHFDLAQHFRINGVGSLHQLKDHSLLIGTDKGLLQAFNKPYLDSLNFKRIPTLNDLTINTLDIDGSNRAWVGTADGLYLLDQSLSSARLIDLGDLHGLTTPIRYLTVSKEHVWVSVVGNGVFQLDLSGRILNRYNTQNGFYHNEINHIFVDSQERVWFGASSAGLAVKLNDAIRYLSKNREFPGHDVNSITEDVNGDIWVATSGLGVFQYTNDQFIEYSNSQNILSNYCNSIISDLAGNVWVAHRQGLSRIDHETKKITQYRHESELGEVEVVMNSITLDDLGNVWLGNPFGITEIDRPERSFRPKTLNTLITDLKLFYQEVDLPRFSKKGYGDFLIPDGLVFPYDQNDITFEFMAVHLKNPDHVYYQFQLVGHEREWSPATQDNHTTYTNLAPGRYRFKVRESDNSDYWSEENFTEFEFRILKPYWEQWWFYSSEIGFILFVVIGAYVSSQHIKNRFLLRLMMYVSIFIVFEFIHTLMEPYIDSFAGSAPLFQVLLNLLLALVLFPAEHYITRYFQYRDRKAQRMARSIG